MPHCLVENGIVVQLDLTGSPPDGYIECPENVQPGFTYIGGEFSAAEVPAPSVDDYEATIQAHVDETARGRQFRDGVTLASYVTSTNVQWAGEAQAFVAWRDSVWAYCYSELEKVETGQRQQPSIDAILHELPTIAWPL